ncbi:MAG: hypothetical protein JXB39_10185 [Deltaproteobacteria bacterium]|nr:hypothetical protein [Deltaproteobacteria bacterium]
MRASSLLRYGFGILLALQLGTAFAGVALLARMAPAVERIIQENTRSLEATERMLAALSARDGPTFAQALDEARRNVTEDGEVPALATIEDHWRQALDGNAVAEVVVRGQCLELARVNHAAMERTDAEARRLGKAGSVTMVLLGILGFLAATMVFGRTKRDVVRPLEDLSDAVRQVAAGDTLRRCGVLRGVEEVVVTARGIDRVLDASATPRDTGRESGWPARSAALEALLAEVGPMAVLVAADGAILATSPEARDALLGPDGAALRAAIAERAPERVTAVRDLPDGLGSVLVLGQGTGH